MARDGGETLTSFKAANSALERGVGRRLRHSLNMRSPTRLRQGKFAKAANEKPRPMRIKGRGLLSLGETDVLGETSCPNPTIGFAGHNSRICNLMFRPGDPWAVIGVAHSLKVDGRPGERSMARLLTLIDYLPWPIATATGISIRPNSR